MVVSDAGELCAIADTRYGAEPWVQAGDRIVECVPMPRVTLKHGKFGTLTLKINGVEVVNGMQAGMWQLARDLRRALRGK